MWKTEINLFRLSDSDSRGCAQKVATPRHVVSFERASGKYKQRCAYSATSTGTRQHSHRARVFSFPYSSCSLSSIYFSRYFFFTLSFPGMSYMNTSMHSFLCRALSVSREQCASMSRDAFMLRLTSSREFRISGVPNGSFPVFWLSSSSPEASVWKIHKK